MFLKPESVYWVWVTTDSVIMTEAGYVLYIALQSDAAGASAVGLYDGIDSSGDLIDLIRANQYNRTKINYSIPRAVKKGLFLDLGANVEGVLVGFTYEDFTYLDTLAKT